jgi:hypothetical protein
MIGANAGWIAAWVDANVAAVNGIIDLIGATGRAYRFRKLGGALSSIGGNFVYVRDRDGTRRVVCCGRARSLAWGLSERDWHADENASAEDQLYGRLNAIRIAREEEHEDLLASLPRPFTTYEIE